MQTILGKETLNDSCEQKGRFENRAIHAGVGTRLFWSSLVGGINDEWFETDNGTRDRIDGIRDSFFPFGRGTHEIQI